jgi:hypothetical protein
MGLFTQNVWNFPEHLNHYERPLSATRRTIEDLFRAMKAGKKPPFGEFAEDIAVFLIHSKPSARKPRR